MKRGHPSLQNMNFSKKFLLLWAFFAILDPDPDFEYGSRSTDPVVRIRIWIRIRIRNPAFLCKRCRQHVVSKVEIEVEGRGSSFCPPLVRWGAHLVRWLRHLPTTGKGECVRCTHAISASNLGPRTPNLVPLCSLFSFRSPSFPSLHLARSDKKSAIREQHYSFLPQNWFSVRQEESWPHWRPHRSTHQCCPACSPETHTFNSVLLLNGGSCNACITKWSIAFHIFYAMLW
jgi:hypothetical protein